MLWSNQEIEATASIYQSTWFILRLGQAKFECAIRTPGRKEKITSCKGLKGVEFIRLYVDRKEVPLLINALKDYMDKHPAERYTVEKLLNKIIECSKLQVSQKPKN